MSAEVFLKACFNQPTEYTPVWFMRQAGRYLPEYRAIRSKLSLLEICRRPEVACEVTLQPVERLGVDAAILFADILLPFEPMGLGLSFRRGEGPVIERPIRKAEDVRRLRDLDPKSDLGYVMETIRLVRHRLGERTPLIGFAGAPFTLASYAVEGGSTRSFVQTKTLMYSDPETWHALMDKLAVAVGRYLACQIEAGAQALQLFDSWAGALSPDDYRRYALPYTAKALALARKANRNAPIIHFGTGTSSLLELMAEAGGEVIGIDWRIPLDQARSRLPGRAIQGNLDPCALLGSVEELESQVLAVLRRAGGQPGHIFNLGHGVLPQTDPDRLRRVVDLVHERSAARV
ncbi:MAG: uroporphyrinogen decarboxylase [Gemmatimonadales bacterium]|nr:MAG: uroporphyrinogen decarboxylase [Gemmatimonadales bacterium]